MGLLVLAGIIASAGQLATTKGYRITTGAIGVYAYSSIPFMVRFLAVLE